jgi:FkbM family methyltransferase
MKDLTYSYFLKRIKKVIKYFIPYGFLALKQKFKDREPLNLEYQKISGNDLTNYLCDTSIEKLSEKDDVIKICREDYLYPIYLRNHTADVSVYRSIIDNHEYNFITKSEPKYIIDAGANIGIATIYFANKYKNAQIIAIEPEDQNYELLKQNTEVYKNIIIIKAALWNTMGKIPLFDTDHDNWGFMVALNKSDLKTVTKNVKQFTDTITVNEIINKYNIDSIDVLKIDIEGSEKEVFETCESWIYKTKSIIIELHERKKNGCNNAFYKNIKFFDQVGKHGEDIYLSNENYIKMSS